MLPWTKSEKRRNNFERARDRDLVNGILCGGAGKMRKMHSAMQQSGRDALQTAARKSCDILLEMERMELSRKLIFQRACLAN